MMRLSNCNSQVPTLMSEMRYCEIGKEMSSLYFGLDVFGQFEARVPEFDAVFSVQCTLHRGEGRSCVSNSGTQPQIGRIQLTQITIQ